MSHRHAAVRLGVLVVLLIPFQAQSQQDQFLSRLEGAWEGEGKGFGMPARLQLNWQWVLDKKFLRLTLRNEMTTAGQKQIFEGNAYYKTLAADKYEAQWFDSRGITFPIKAQVEGDSLVAYWGSPDKEEGKSIYRLSDKDTMEVVDSVKQKDGSWREFGRVVVRRQPVNR
jgi:hypothetical protein